MLPIPIIYNLTYTEHSHAYLDITWTCVAVSVLLKFTAHTKYLLLTGSAHKLAV